VFFDAHLGTPARFDAHFSTPAFDAHFGTPALFAGSLYTASTRIIKT